MISTEGRERIFFILIMGRTEIGSSENTHNIFHSNSLRLEMASATIYRWSSFLDLCLNVSGWALSRIIRT